jgi:hypothetical protein
MKKVTIILVLLCSIGSFFVGRLSAPKEKKWHWATCQIDIPITVGENGITDIKIYAARNDNERHVVCFEIVPVEE